MQCFSKQQPRALGWNWRFLLKHPKLPCFWPYLTPQEAAEMFRRNHGWPSDRKVVVFMPGWSFHRQVFESILCRFNEHMTDGLFSSYGDVHPHVVPCEGGSHWLHGLSNMRLISLQEARAG
eukprot:CAMPEP_0198437512 /NCGR_PEP_ID=MMETSP1452-20131203/47261_1 /TAXON_ID=1181717 /ORGANISM="Synchroma pusillum, Strain CCMP3072" /LENGTH=120 /DNA_ID=CAMNT_0044158081 /DNA_START=20 /DNA_END=378 /DNA_ORIENTATION=+